jgi:hypothetical protein
VSQLIKLRDNNAKALKVHITLPWNAEPSSKYQKLEDKQEETMRINSSPDVKNTSWLIFVEYMSLG